MARLVIRGGNRLSGVHRSPGNKNAALPMLAATLLTDEPVCLRNLPLIRDVMTMLEILDDLGASVELKGHNVTICAKGVKKTRLNPELCSRVRSSILFAGPLAARHGRATLFAPGGDAIGRRRLDTHFDALEKLGIKRSSSNNLAFKRQNFKAACILLDEASVTATENTIMAAVLAGGRSTIFNAACEPHVQDLCNMLRKMGARLAGIGTNFVRISGVTELRGVTHTIQPDIIDTLSFAAAAAITGGELTIENAAVDEINIVARSFNRLGVKWTAGDNSIHLAPNQKFKIQNDFGSRIPKIEDGTWPGFPSDLMSIAIVLATQATGSVLFFEKMFESRMYFVDRLIEMGGRIVQCDPHRIIVAGPSRLQGSHMSSPDIRAGIALVLAALCARGESVIENAQSIDRGYEKVDQSLRRLGADITRVE